MSAQTFGVETLFDIVSRIIGLSDFSATYGIEKSRNLFSRTGQLVSCGEQNVEPLHVGCSASIDGIQGFARFALGGTLSLQDLL